MAEKLENTLSKGQASVSHRGKDVNVSLPEWIKMAEETFFSEEALLEHCRAHGILLSTLQEGFAQHLINLRAKARPADLPPEEKGGKPRPQDIEQASAQERVDAHKPEPRQPSGKKLLTREQKHAELVKMGFTDAQATMILDLEENS